MATPGKLNDGTIPVQLTLQGPRGRGIDGLWRKKATGPQKYGVVEAKCYMNPMQSLGRMLDDVFDKDEHAAYRDELRKSKGMKAAGSKRKAGSKGAATSSSPPSTPVAPPTKPGAHVMQMSHIWIQQRLKGGYDKDVRNDILQKFGSSPNYSRHVMLVSVPSVLKHYEAIEAAVLSNASIEADANKEHTITREFGDVQISQEEQSRKASRNGSSTGQNL